MSVAVGSAVSMGDGVVITNRHVVEGADRLELTTWDGRDIAAPVAAMSYVGDAAVIRTNARNLPSPPVRTSRLPRSSLIRAVGYPEGGEFEINNGVVIDYVGGAKFEQAGKVLRARVKITHGNSGGPVLDAGGHLVGIVFGSEIATGAALIIPARELSALAGSTLEPVEGTCS